LAKPDSTFLKAMLASYNSPVSHAFSMYISTRFDRVHSRLQPMSRHVAQAMAGQLIGRRVLRPSVRDKAVTALVTPI